MANYPEWVNLEHVKMYKPVGDGQLAETKPMWKCRVDLGDDVDDFLSSYGETPDEAVRKLVLALKNLSAEALDMISKLEPLTSST